MELLAYYSSYDPYVTYHRFGCVLKPGDRVWYQLNNGSCFTDQIHNIQEEAIAVITDLGTVVFVSDYSIAAIKVKDV